MSKRIIRRSRTAAVERIYPFENIIHWKVLLHLDIIREAKCFKKENDGLVFKLPLLVSFFFLLIF